MALFVKPAVLPDGGAALVRQPERGYAPLPPEGAPVPPSTYWLRRLRDGDVVEADPTATLDGLVEPPALSGFEPPPVVIHPHSAPARTRRSSR